MNKEYYDGTKLLTLKDLDGEKPEIYMCVGNRTAGKTYFFKRLMIRKYLKYNQKFVVLVRYGYELQDIGNSFFKDLAQIDYPANSFKSRTVGRDLYSELYLDNRICGYAIPLNNADTIRKYSSKFVDVDNIFMDEFQSETGKYTPKEITKFMSIHVSIARGQGQHVRYVPVYMCANAVTVLNPYFIAFGVHKRLTPNTKYLRGKGWVLEQCYVETASQAIKGSAFGKAFEDSSYMNFATSNVYLLDENNFCEKMDGQGTLQVNLISDGVVIGVWDYLDANIVYITHKHDPRFPYTITFNTKDHKKGTTLVSKNNKWCKYMKQMFENGQMRFEDTECKNIALDFMGFATN